MTAIYDFDLSVFSFLDRLHTPFLDGLLSLITHLCDGGICWILLAVVLLIFKRTRPCGAALAVSLIACLLFNNMLLKNVIDRPRPYIKYELEALIPWPSGSSFPSGHSSSSFASACALAFTLHRPAPSGAGLDRRTSAALTAATYVFAVLIAFSRVFLRVHYLTDVLGGAVSGTICALIGTFIASAICRAVHAKRYAERIRPTE